MTGMLLVELTDVRWVTSGTWNLIQGRDKAQVHYSCAWVLLSYSVLKVSSHACKGEVRCQIVKISHKDKKYFIS